MNEAYLWWCDVGNQTAFKLSVVESAGNKWVGELYRVENPYMIQSDSENVPPLKSGPSEAVAGVNLEDVLRKAKVRVEALGFKFSAWKK